MTFIITFIRSNLFSISSNYFIFDPKVNFIKHEFFEPLANKIQKRYENVGGQFLLTYDFIIFNSLFCLYYA